MIRGDRSGRRALRITVVEPAPPLVQTAAAAGAGACAGALGQYLLDPDRGRARRARVRDKAVHAAHRCRSGAGVLARDLGNRTRGALAGVRYRLLGRTVDDRVLHERVRAELGRYVGHPHAIEVKVTDGVVTLTGDLLERESRRARRAVARVPGVKQVNAHWTVHHDAAGVARLQGPGRPREHVPEFLQERWSPTARFLAAGGAVSAWVLSRRRASPAAWALRVVATLLAARAATNLPLKRLTGVAAGRRAVHVRDAVTVAAPPQDVWPLLADYGLFPQCMPDVLEVRRSADGRRSHWVISGPAGVPLRFDATETKREEGREIAWKTTEGQFIAHAGTLRLVPEGEGRSRVEVRLMYNPVIGAVGHAMAVLLGADPARKLREGLMRLRSLVETGQAAGAGPVSRSGTR